MRPKEIVTKWVKRFNAGDAAGIAELYHEDAVNHQVTQEPVVGRGATRALFAREFAAAKMVCIVEAIHEAGEVAALEMARPARTARLRLLYCAGRAYRFPARLLGQALIPKMHGLPIE